MKNYDVLAILANHVMLLEDDIVLYQKILHKLSDLGLFWNTGQLAANWGFDKSKNLIIGYQNCQPRLYISNKYNLNPVLSGKEVLEILEQNTNNMNKECFQVSRSDLGRIYNIACTSWKEKIASMVVKIPAFSTILSLTFQEVKEMFDAANTEQRKLLAEIFPSYKEGKRNAFVNEASGTEYGLLKKLSIRLFDDPYYIQFYNSISEYSTSLSINRPDLRDKAFYFSKDVEVKLHSTSLGETIVEVIKK